MDTEMQCTPIALKTRRAKRLKSRDGSPPPISDSLETGVLDTPRRSARKSVRPLMDYDDIVSASDVNKNNKPQETPKWKAEDVGRSSSKRGRKHKQTKKTEIVSINQADENESKQMDQNMEISDSPDPNIVEKSDQDFLPKPIISKDDMNDMELTLLKDDVDEENQEVMPSLILMEDGELADDIGENAKESTEVANQSDLNTTYEKEELEQTEKCDEIIADQSKLNTTFEKEEIIADQSKLNTTFEKEELEQTERSGENVDQIILHTEKTDSNELIKNIKMVLTTSEGLDSTLLVLNREENNRVPSPTLTIHSLFNFTINPGEKPLTSNLRRRSRSVSELKSKNVTFYSPIEVAQLEEIDKRWNYVTKRRKRSLSVDDSNYFKSRIPKPTAINIIPMKNIKNSPRKVQSRVKIPDFAAIHKKNFSKMENLVEHLERKAERAKVLTSSASKLGKLPSSVQKSTSKNVQSKISKQTGPRPRAAKKIDLPTDRPIEFTEEELQRMEILPYPKPPTVQTQVNANRTLLPIRRAQPQAAAGKIQAKISDRSMLSVRVPLKTNNTTLCAMPSRPVFNFNASRVPVATTAATSGSTWLQDSRQMFHDKVLARRQRNEELLKGRAATKNRAERKDILKGVRLNRRFELQMEHRNNVKDA